MQSTPTSDFCKPSCSEVFTMPAYNVALSEGDGGRRSWLVLVLISAAITSSSLSLVCLYHVLALRAEVEGLRTEVSRKREEQSRTLEEERQAFRQEEDESQEQTEYLKLTVADDVINHTVMSKRSLVPVPSKVEHQACLQLMANNKRKTFQKEFESELCTAIPWIVGLQHGSALEEEEGIILVLKEGFFLIYSQVYYTDATFAMGHILIRIKKNLVGDESQNVVLFRCIQSMNRANPYNTCFTGGVVKLDSGDRLELLIPRSHANISLDGDATFFGAIKLV